MGSACSSKQADEPDTQPLVEAKTDDTAAKLAAAPADEKPAVSIDAAPVASANGGEEDSGEEEEAHLDIPFESTYLGKHKLGVNRVNSGKRNGKAEIFREANALVLTAEVAQGPYRLAVNGIVKPVSKTEFVLDGMLRGVPNLNFAGKPAKEVTTEGSFTFRATKGRKYWRLYDVDGEECVCQEGCGNEFCYIDLSF
tara:strand:- start:64876 stop:65466 length:591 start_codon:yes stop_codon:yes gene_type:complete